MLAERKREELKMDILSIEFGKARIFVLYIYRYIYTQPKTALYSVNFSSTSDKKYNKVLLVLGRNV